MPQYKWVRYCEKKFCKIKTYETGDRLKDLIRSPNEAKLEQSTNHQTENCSVQEKRSSAKQETGYNGDGERGNSRELYMVWKPKGNTCAMYLCQQK